MIAAVELTDFDEGIILPHEKIHSGPKEDRLRLLKTMQTNTEQIFILYPDAENSDQHIDPAGRSAASDPTSTSSKSGKVTCVSASGSITDPATLDAIQAEMAPLRNLIIADGHHRYSTGLAYRDQQRAAHPDAPPNAAFNFVQATLVSMNDPGLVVLPTHREICNFTATAPADILQRAQEHFALSAAPDLDTCLNTINAHPAGHAFGFYGGPDVGFHVLTLKRDDLAFTPDRRRSLAGLEILVREHSASCPAGTGRRSTG